MDKMDLKILQFLVRRNIMTKTWKKAFVLVKEEKFSLRPVCDISFQVYK